MRLPDGSEGLVEYVRDEKRRIVGAVVATGPATVGWSLCHPKQNRFDKRNKQIAIVAAAGRSRIGTDSVPHPNYAEQIEEITGRMHTRSMAYFKPVDSVLLCCN